MIPSFSRPASIAVLACLLAACGTPADRGGHADHEVAFVAQDEALAAALRHDEAAGAWVLPTLRQPLQPFNRVGLRFDALHTPVVEVRVAPRDGTFGGWLAVPIRWHEAPAHNAHVEMPTGAVAAEMRFRRI
ncbi:MAG: hypothetical protein ACK4N5_12785, partial [Myxococcales bacterium]